MISKSFGKCAVATSAVTAIMSSMVIAVGPSMAQLSQNRPAQPRSAQGARRVPARNYLPELKQIAEDMSKQYGAKIVVDGTLLVPSKPAAPDAGLTIDKAMDALLTATKDLAWRRIYLSQAQGPIVPPADKLVESVRALDKLEQNGLVLENPVTRKATTYLKDWTVSPNFKEELTAGQFSATPIYVLYSQHALSGKSTMEELADMQRRSMEMMMSLDPDQMAQAMNQGLDMLMNMDPDTRSRFMSMQMQAGMRMMQNMTPEQRNQLIQQSMQAMQAVGGPGALFGGQPGGGNGNGGRRP